MAKKKQKPDLPEDNNLFAASTNDMTGLIPGNIPDEEERESYEEVYPYQAKAVKKR